MNKALIKNLEAMDDVAFRQLEIRVALAREVRTAMSRGAIGRDEMAAILHVTPRQMKAVINGAYNFDLRLMAALQAHCQERAAEAARIKIKAESIGFADYSKQSPALIERVTTLLNRLDKGIDTGAPPRDPDTAPMVKYRRKKQ